MIEHLTDKDYLTSYDGKTFSNLGERIENVENEKEIIKTVKLENTKPIFKIGTDKNGTDISNGISDGEVSVELQGRTLQNLANARSINITVDNDGYLTPSGSIYALSSVDKMLKTNTTYTLIFDIKENTLDGVYRFSVCNLVGSTSPTIAKAGQTGIVKQVYTTGSSFSSDYKDYVFRTNEGKTGSITYRFMLLEGDYTNIDVPYFEGIKSVGESKEIEISSVGKNLLMLHDIESNEFGVKIQVSNQKLTVDGSIGTNKWVWINFTNTHTILCSGDPDKNKIGYAINGVISQGKTIINPILLAGTKNPSAGVRCFDLEGNRLGVTKDGTNYVCEGTIGAISYYLGSGITYSPTLEMVFQVETNDTTTEYEPYKSSKTKILLNEPLRSIPDGVCDEIVDGKIIRRVGKHTFNGTETWHGSINTNDFYTSFDDLVKLGSKSTKDGKYYVKAMFCDKMLTVSKNFNDTDKSNICITGYNDHLWNYEGQNWVYVYHRDIPNATSLKTWLAENPVTIYYERATPIIEEIEPIILDSYENGTLFIDSTIVPTSIHQVTLKNMNFLVEKNIKEIAKLKERLSKLKSFYDESLLEVDYQLTKEKLTYYLATYGLGE